MASTSTRGSSYSSSEVEWLRREIEKSSKDFSSLDKLESLLVFLGRIRVFSSISNSSSSSSLVSIWLDSLEESSFLEDLVF